MVVVQITQIYSKSYMNAGKNWNICLLCRRGLLLKRIMFNKIFYVLFNQSENCLNIQLIADVAWKNMNL